MPGLNRREILSVLGAAVVTAALPEVTQAESSEVDSTELIELIECLRQNFALKAPEMQDHAIPSAPTFGEADKNIIAVANEVLQLNDPKSAVYPRVVWGGVPTPEREAYVRKAALLEGAKQLGIIPDVTDEWSLLSYAGNEWENGAWFYPLTETSNNPDQVRTGQIEETVFDSETKVVSTPIVKLDGMMAVNLAHLENVGVRSLPKVTGQLSFVLADGETRGNVIAGFSMNPHFVENLTGGDPASVPAVIVQGMPGAAVEVNYFDTDGNLVNTVNGRIETTNGTISIEVPADGGFVTIGVPMRGDHKNANTELIMRCGTQPQADIPGKNYIARSSK